MKSIIINGSPRKKGNTAYICGIAEEILQGKGYSTEILNLSEIEFSTCKGCEKCRRDEICTGLNDGLTGYYDTIKNADLWVLGTPVHNYNVTALMKAFIDRLYCFYDFTEEHPRGFSSRLSSKGIKAVIFGIGEQLSEEDFGFTIEAMEKPLTALGIEVIESFKFYGYFEPGSLKKDTGRIELFKNNFNAAID
ncbi:MAG TPA: flavodoxin family protein [Spirochaetota bacterium]|nr:flavodoxin family protein [Spirochaetota bacterium]HPJ33416.1 flavodoxin family protein [Spirochaetota bacterium]